MLLRTRLLLRRGLDGARLLDLRLSLRHHRRGMRLLHRYRCRGLLLRRLRTLLRHRLLLRRLRVRLELLLRHAGLRLGMRLEFGPLAATALR